MNPESEIVENPVETSEMIRQRIADELKELGVSECPKEIIDRFLLIEQNSKFYQDSQMIREGFGNILNSIDSKNGAEIKLSEKQKREGELSAYLHDIGKSSSHTEADCQLSVVKLFSVENVKDQNQTVGETIREAFPDQYDQMLKDLSLVGVTAEMSMRAFWDKHAFWTKEILERYPDVIPTRVRLVAASHHVDHGINPYNLSEDMVPDESKIIGSLEYYVDVLEERALMAIDQYQAAMFRGGSKHEKAMEYIRKSFQKYAGDPIIESIINAIDELGSQNLLFPKTTAMNLAKRK